MRKILLIGVLISLFLAGNVFAMMGGAMGARNGSTTVGAAGSMMSGTMGTSTSGMAGGNAGGMMSGSTSQGTNSGHMKNGGGMGSGMAGAGGMVSGMMKNTMAHGYLDILSPLVDSAAAIDAIEAFIDASNSNLKILELWEYETVYKAELSDTTGARALDLLADKATGAVMPEMGLSMMMNASYGKSLYKMAILGRKQLPVTQEQATIIAQGFVDKNNETDPNLLSYTLGAAEVYPGFYKFHTKDTTIVDSNGDLSWGMDIMVNGYNGKIWMDTHLGVPLAKSVE